jgi:competence protein ComEA
VAEPSSHPEPEPVAPLTWRQRIELLTEPPLPPLARLVAVGGVVVVVAVVGAVALLRPDAPAPELSLPVAGSAGDPAGTTTTAPVEVVAHVAGAVASPGVYRLGPGARVADLLEVAGGAAEGADVGQVNLAAPVVDGERLYVPKVGEVVAAPSTPTSGSTPGSPTALVDLNTADAAALEALPGIGPATAAAILEERGRRGRFSTVDELLDVSGIGEAKLEQLRDLVRVS